MSFEADFAEACDEVERVIDAGAAMRKKRKDRDFYDGVCVALGVLDSHGMTGGPEYMEIVNAVGGFMALLRGADNFDREHLLAAMRMHRGDEQEDSQ